MTLPLKRFALVFTVFLATPGFAQSNGGFDGGEGAAVSRRIPESRCAAADSACVARYDGGCRDAGGHSQVRTSGGRGMALTCDDGSAVFSAVPPSTRMCSPSNPVCTCSGNLSGGYGSVHVCMVNAFTACITAGGTMSGGIIPDGPDSGTFIGTCVPRA